MSSPKDPVKQSDLIYEMDAYSKYFSKMLLRRAVKAPFMNIVRILRLVTFQFSKNHYRLKHLRDKYEGKRCFIVGNGPSLTIEDLDKLKGEHCFAFNKIYEVFDKTDWRPEFYMVLDNDVIKTTATHIEKVRAKFKILNVMGKVVGLKEDDSTIFFCSYGWYRIREFAYKKKHISKDISQYISLNFTVTCAAIETAIYLGFKEIVLVGIDNSFSRWIDGKGVVHNKDVENYRLTSPHQFQSLCYLDAVNSCYRCYCDYAQKNNIKILNATKGGSLEVFERIDLDKALEMPESFS